MPPNTKQFLYITSKTKVSTCRISRTFINYTKSNWLSLCFNKVMITGFQLSRSLKTHTCEVPRYLQNHWRIFYHLTRSQLWKQKQESIRNGENDVANYFFLFTCTSIRVQHSESLIWKHLWDQKVRWLSSGNKTSLICLQLGSWQPQSTCGVISLNMNYLIFLTDCQRLIAYNLLIWGYTKTTSIRNRFHQLLMKSASLVLSLPYVLIN